MVSATLKGDELSPLLLGAEASRVFNVEPQRFYILALFSLLSCLQCLVWFTFSSVEYVNDYYHIDDQTTFLLLNWGPIIFIPVIFVVSWMQTKSGALRASMGAGCWLTFAGAFVRTIPCFLPGDFHQTTGAVVFLHLGQILNAATGAVVLGLPSKLSAVWFADDERATATAFAYVANGLGTTVGYLIGPALVTQTSEMPNLLYVEIGLCAIPVILFHIHFPNQPKLAPSVSAEEYQAGGYKRPFFKGLLTACKDFNFVLTVLAGGILCGINAAWQGVLTDMLQPQFSPSLIGWIGFGNTLAGIVGGLVSGRLCDRYFRRRYKELMLGLFAACIALYVWFTLSLPTPFGPALLPSNLGTVMSSIVLAGFLEGCIEPIFYELSAEMVYPVPEATSAGVLVLLFNAASLIFLFVAGAINPDVINMIQTGGITLCMLMLIFARVRYYRSEHEAEQLQNRGMIN